MNICVYGASSKTIDESYLEAGEKLGRLMAERGHTLVFGGGQGGLMGAVARGMTAGKGYIIGISPRYFDVDGIAIYTGLDMKRTYAKGNYVNPIENLHFVFEPAYLEQFDQNDCYAAVAWSCRVLVCL